MTSHTSGYITAANEETHSGHERLALNTLLVPAGNVVMISLAHLNTLVRLTLYFRDSNGSVISQWNQGRNGRFIVNVYNVSSVTLQLSNPAISCLQTYCLKLVFSFHSKSTAPQRLGSGLYNCSVDDYWRFRQHLDCNLKVECEDGRDESGPCPVTSPACRPWGTSGRKCFKFVSTEALHSLDTTEISLLTRAVKLCGSEDSSLGQPRDKHDFRIMRTIFLRHALRMCFAAITGLYVGGISVPNMYRKSVVTIDRTVLHHTINNYMGFFSYQGEETCLGLLSGSLMHRRCSFFTTELINACATCEIISEERGIHHV